MKLQRHVFAKRGRIDHAPPASSWDYLSPWAGGTRDMALIVCSAGHATRLSADVHSVAGDGVVSPSYVCPIDGCTFHEFIQLEGWSFDEWDEILRT